jgi:hypothetical protein
LKAVETANEVTEMQTYQITVTAGDATQTFEINISDLNFCDLVQRAGLTDPEQHDRAVCAAAVDNVIEMFASLE